ncbi:MAG: hypothetical protein U0X73_16795 [Thermoanaerobaculia bacterium]
MSPGTAGRRVVGAAVVVLAVVWLWPPLGQPAVPGLDHGYAWGLNEAHARGWTHGAELTFPYGPLGWVLLAQPVGDNLAGQRIFQLASQALLAIGLAIALAEGAALAAIVGFVAVWLFAVDRLAIQLELQHVLVLAVLLAPSTIGERVRRGTGALAGVWAVVLALAKTSLGVVAVALLAGWAAALAVRRPAGWRRELAWTALAAGAATVVGIAALFGSVPTFLHWLALEHQLLAGFSAAMSLPGPRTTLTAGLALLLACAAAPALAFAARARVALWWAAVLPAVAIVWKHGFVRQDVHVDLFLFFLAGLVGVAALLVRRPGDLVPLVAIVAALVGANAVTTRDLGTPHPPSGASIFLGRTGRANLLGAFDLGGRQRILYAESGDALAPLAWGEGARRLAAAGGTFDVVPWDLVRLPINDLAWRPNPLLQLYTAYTPRLDAEIARHFAGERAPDHLLVHFAPIDDRQTLWEAPATWEAIAERYAPAAEQPLAKFLVLDRRATPRAVERRELGRAALVPWVRSDLPAIAPGEELTVALALRPTPFGRLRGALYRTEPVLVEVGFLPGRRQTFRLLPAQAGGDLLLDPPCRSLSELAAWLAGNAGSHPTSLRLVGAGIESFASPVEAVFAARRRAS